MGFLEIGALILRSLQIVSNNPALGGGSTLRMQEISELLGLFGQLFERGDEALDELKAFAAIVEAMAKEGRNPSPAEWETLRGRSDAAHDVIQQAAEAAREEEEEEEDDDPPPPPPPPAEDTLPDDDNPIVEPEDPPPGGQIP